MADKEDIDFTELEKELEAAIDQDSRYWLQNDAKIRAVNQRVATYDEFRSAQYVKDSFPVVQRDVPLIDVICLLLQRHCESCAFKAH